jgi:transposase
MTKLDLPNDIEALKDLVIQTHDQLAQKHELLAQEHQRAELFKHRYELLARRYFGQSSEKRKDAPGQQMLFELPGEPERPAPADTEKQDEALRKRKHGGGRKPIPPELPRQEIKYTLPEEKRICTCCGEVMQPFGEEVTEQLEFIPASLFVIRHVKIKYACNKGCAEKPAIAPGPQKVIDRISAGPGLLAWNVVAKFQHHQPMYRQEDIFKQHGDEISRSTQCSWQATVADLLEPIYRRMATHVVQSRKIHTDDSAPSEGWRVQWEVRPTGVRVSAP